MLKKLCIGVAVLGMACGSGSGGGSDEAPYFMVGTTKVTVGETKTITAQVGDTITFEASEGFGELAGGHRNGETCSLEHLSRGYYSPTGSVKILAGTTQCIFAIEFPSDLVREAVLIVDVP